MTGTDDEARSDAEHLRRRVEALEIKAAHQDRAIEDLNATITAQWRIVDALRREILTMGERLQDIAARRDAGEEPPPPHY